MIRRIAKKAQARRGQQSVGELVDADTAHAVLEAERFGNEEPDSDEQRFIDTVTKWLRDWLDHATDDQCNRSLPSAFVFSGDRSTSTLLADLQHAPSFRRTFDQELSGYVQICSLELKKVCRRYVGFDDASATLQWLSSSPVSDCAMVVWVPKNRITLVRRAGVDFDDCEQLPIGPQTTLPFDFAQIDGLLTQFHQKWTRTHHGYCRIWAKPAKRELKPAPESQIQGSLKAYFDFTVRPYAVHVEEEFFTYLGRGDVRLVHLRRGSTSKDSMIETCIMELKVLDKDRGPKGNREWALKGIGQVVNYRSTEFAVGPSYLCCFDGRYSNADIPEVLKAAKAASIEARRYFMETPGCAS